MPHNTQKGGAVVWAALLISIIALILAWAAYNRTGTDLESQIKAQVEEAVSQIDTQTDEAGDAGDEATDGEQSTTTGTTTE